MFKLHSLISAPYRVKPSTATGGVMTNVRKALRTSILEGTEKLNYLTGRLGDEIAQLRGKRPSFAPNWAAPDRVAHALKRDVPLWVIGSVFALAGLLAFLGLRWTLERKTQSDLSAYSQVVKLAPQSANITITLP